MAGAGYQPTTMASTRGPGFVSGYSYLFCESSALLLAVFLLFEVFAFGYLEPCRFWGKSAHHEPEKVFTQYHAPLSSLSFRFSHSVTQVVSRLLPFIVNTMVARRLAPEEFGVPTVHFQLLSTVILTCREGFRRALMRHGDTDARERDANDESQGASHEASRARSEVILTQSASIMNRGSRLARRAARRRSVHRCPVLPLHCQQPRPGRSLRKSSRAVQPCGVP